MDTKIYDEVIQECVPEVFLLFVSSYSEIKIENRVKLASIFTSMVPLPQIMLITKKNVVECDPCSLAKELGANRFDFPWSDIMNMFNLYRSEIKDYKKLFAYYYLEPPNIKFLKDEGFMLIDFNNDESLEEIIKYV